MTSRGCGARHENGGVFYSEEIRWYLIVRYARRRRQPGGRKTIAHGASRMESGCFLPAPERGGRRLAKTSSAPFRGLSSPPTYPNGLRRGLFSFAPTELKGAPDAGKRSTFMSCTPQDAAPAIRGALTMPGSLCYCAPSRVRSSGRSTSNHAGPSSTLRPQLVSALTVSLSVAPVDHRTPSNIAGAILLHAMA